MRRSTKRRIPTLLSAWVLVMLAASPASAVMPIQAPRVVTPGELAGWFVSTGKQPHPRLGISIRGLADHFITEGRAEGVRGDVAFAQSIIETGYFSFPSYGQVSPEDNNYGGLGAVDGGNDPVRFPTPKIGVRAQIQHLRAYAQAGITRDDLAYPLVDTRFDLVTKGSAPNWTDLGNGRWATDPDYATKIRTVFAQVVRWADARRTAIPLSGDWNGDGRDTPGWFKDGLVFLRDRNTAGWSHVFFRYGKAGDVPVVGDWNGDGRDTIGVRRGRAWYLRNSNSTGAPSIAFSYGGVNAVPVVGDWNGDGRDTVGVRRGGIWRLRNRNTAGRAQIRFRFGHETAAAVTGDWDGDGDDTVGVRRGRTWRLRDRNSAGPARVVTQFGDETAMAVTGDWTADGDDDVGATRGVRWSLKNLANEGWVSRSFVYRR